jgi:hypothetical protein
MDEITSEQEKENEIIESDKTNEIIEVVLSKEEDGNYSLFTKKLCEKLSE